jgi:hypothetical protein
MTAKFMKTPVGDMPIRKHVIQAMSKMTDREIADRALRSGRFIDPEYFAELCHRGLSGPGMFEVDTYELIEKRESATKLRRKFYEITKRSIYERTL